MSGPVPDEQVYNRDSNDLEKRHIQKLRDLADKLEDGWLSDFEGLEDNQRIAQFLRMKADKLETAMRMIDKEFYQGFRDLVKAVEWCDSGDYGGNQVQEAWENLDEYFSSKSDEVEQ